MDEHPRLKLGYYLFLAGSWFFAGLGAIMLAPNSAFSGWPLLITGLVVGVGLIVFDYIWTIVRLNPKRLSSAVKESQVVWAFWHAGGRAVLDNVVQRNKSTSIKKMMLLNPDSNNLAFRFIAELVDRNDENGVRQLIAEINTMANLATSVGVKVMYHSEPLAYTFTIFDKTPNGDIPNSKNAWIVVQPLEPSMQRESAEWQKWVVRNKGKTRSQFDAYFSLFTQIEKKIKNNKVTPPP
jgi:hypothetical protein